MDLGVMETEVGIDLMVYQLNRNGTRQELV